MANGPCIAPHGSWRSLITADVILAGLVVPGEIRVAGEDMHWLEGRPQEGGRRALVRRSAEGQVTDLTPPPFDVRDRVHQYGGGAYAVDGGIAYFSNFSDNRLYRLEVGEEPMAITQEAPLYYGDIAVDRARNRLLCVREDHSESDQNAVNTLVAVDLSDGEQRILASGNDFYSSARLSPDGSRLAWLTWNHPNMPWDGTELWVGEITGDGSLSGQRRVAGGLEESIFEPEWSPYGTLYFVSDRTGWWNLYREDLGGVEAVTHEEAEFGRPQWVLGMSTYAFARSGRIFCSVERSGMQRLAEVDPRARSLRWIETPYVLIANVRGTGDHVVFVGAAKDRPPEIVRLDANSGSLEVLRTAGSVPVPAEYYAAPQSIEFPTEGGLTAYAIYYPPHNPDFRAPPGELPPLIVESHGGPTGAASPALSLPSVQYWTSRGFALIDVNYGGSTGYGRAYRERLNGQWGIVDVDDCVNAARYLAAQGLVDPRRLIIRGSSAGGYTTLAALTFRDVFTAGASHFGIGDLEALHEDTHKFESQYDMRLIAQWPEKRQVFRERSPINYVDRISCPIVLFQGEEDRVVPPNQARLMMEALERKGLPHAAMFFPGEGHGFRRAENIKRAMEGELYFYSRIFGFVLAEDVEPVEIANLER
jgi:dipeptidyl aminopeptidase/acylaminoacyl peptidase